MSKKNQAKQGSSSAEIEIKNFDFYYGQAQALFDINLSIEKNEITSFIGPSGCGKSTLLRSINRMNDTIEGTRYDGSIEFEGQNICSPKIDVELLRTKIGMVFQKPVPFPKSIYENIAYGPRIHKMFKTKDELDFIVEDSLKKASLWDDVKDKLHKSAMALSGGQQQRLCIARTISIKPDVILMDEPCSALDPVATLKVESLIDELKQKYTIVVVTHSMQQAARISQKTVFFYKGEIIESGDTKVIFTNPKEKRTADYITGRIG